MSAVVEVAECEACGGDAVDTRTAPACEHDRTVCGDCAPRNCGECKDAAAEQYAEATGWGLPR